MRPHVEREQPKVVVLDCRAITDLEYTALKMLAEAQVKLARTGTELWLAAMNPGVAEMVKRSKVGSAVGIEHMFLSTEAAVETYMKESR